MDLRCENRILHGKLEDQIVEFKCRSARCGHDRGTVVIHRFSAITGELLETQRFKNPISKERTSA